MAMSFRASNNLKEAINCLKQSLEMEQKRPDSPAEHYNIANTLNSIGICYKNLGEYQKALDECFEKAREHLQGAKDDQATKHLKSMLYNNEGICHNELGHYEKALDAYENALPIQKEINASAESLARTLGNIGNVLSAQGRHEEALKKKKESLEKYREHSGQDANTVGIARSLNNIGREYWLLKDYPEAGKWLREALAMKKIVHRGNHPETARTLNSIGLAYSDQGDLNKAKDFHKQAYDMIMACEGYVDDKAMYKRNLDKIEKMLCEK
jgi:tetratricopeptide (TPR) repeat protein